MKMNRQTEKQFSSYKRLKETLKQNLHNEGKSRNVRENIDSVLSAISRGLKKQKK